MMKRTIAICDEKINDNIDDNYVVRTETAKMGNRILDLKGTLARILILMSITAKKKNWDDSKKDEKDEGE